MASSLEWPGTSQFLSAPMEELRIGGVVTGSHMSAAGLTWIQVEGAGHMVPINNPAAASFAIGTLVKSTSGFVDVTNHRIPIIGKWQTNQEPRSSFSMTDTAAAAAGLGLTVFVALWALPRLREGRNRQAALDARLS